MLFALPDLTSCASAEKSRSEAKKLADSVSMEAATLLRPGSSAVMVNQTRNAPAIRLQTSAPVLTTFLLLSRFLSNAVPLAPVIRRSRYLGEFGEASCGA